MEQFEQVIADLTKVIQQLTTIAQFKLKAASQKQVATIDECMTKEQALIMQMKGLERKRERIQEELGYGGLKFQELLAKVPLEKRESLLPMFDLLSREIQLFQVISEDAAKIMQVNLREVNKALEAIENT